MKSLSRVLASIAMKLEDQWIDRITALEQKGQTFGNAEYDSACKNLNAVCSEFWIWDDEK
jgi:hypothetical protein